MMGIRRFPLFLRPDAHKRHGFTLDFCSIRVYISAFSNQTKRPAVPPETGRGIKKEEAVNG